MFAYPFAISVLFTLLGPAIGLAIFLLINVG
jgi:hypothetical protein